MQSKKHSAIEATVNIVIGACIGFTIQYYAPTLLPYSLNAAQFAGIMVGIHMIASWIRSYVLRRVFARRVDSLHVKVNEVESVYYLKGMK